MSITIERLGHLGDGIAQGPIFVPRTLPGEVIEGEVKDARVAAPKIVTPSDDRVKPRCPIYKSCGACALQHASDSFVEGWKADVVRTALAAHDLPAPIRKVVTSPPQSRRRAKLTGRRTKAGALVGFHGRASDVVVHADRCEVISPALVAVLPALEDITTLLGSRKGEISFHVTEADQGIDLLIEGGKTPDAMAVQSLGQIAQRSGIVRITHEGELVAHVSMPTLKLGRAAVPFAAGAFLQATAEGQAALEAGVLEALAGCKSTADLFAGCGTFTFPLAEQGPVHAFEGSKELIAALSQGRDANFGLRAITAQVRDLYRNPLMGTELSGFDGIALDPPRAGAEAQCRALAKEGPGRLAFVSCDPTSFARDARILIEGGYELLWIDVVDQFRWSTHVELVASFVRSA